MEDMSITVEVPEPLASRLAAEADVRGVSAEKVALDTLTERFRTAHRRLEFASIGASSTGRRATDAKEILVAEGLGVDSACL